MDVSIVIVNYNTKELTTNCIKSIFEHTSGCEFEIILVDNASQDGSKEIFESMPGIRYIYNDKNAGFGTANNIGAKVAKGKYFFLLNSDTLLIENSIKILFDHMEQNPQLSLCGANLVNGDRQNSIIGGQFPSLLSEFAAIGFYKLNRKYHNRNIAICQTIDQLGDNTLQYVSGANMFFRADVFNQLGGFDESFFMYYEETDLCKRFTSQGYKLALVPKTTIVHLEGQSTGNQISLKKYQIINRSKMHFYRKHHSRLYLWAVKFCEFMKVVIRPYYYKKDYFILLADVFRM